MISFDAFKMEPGIPIYLQIVLYVKRGIVAGLIKRGDELPSRRILSTLLGVNPNTVQKAYKILEDELLIESHSGAKSEVSFSMDIINSLREELVGNDTKMLISSMKQMGLSKEEAIVLIEKYWDQE